MQTVQIILEGKQPIFRICENDKTLNVKLKRAQLLKLAEEALAVHRYLEPSLQETKHEQTSK